ncbi:carbon-nitrogen hydrolase family protein [Glutamicibacter sp. AOP5-A2-18]|uniref:carbon-nitrogen hydrolase family protein n=1 Tax=Glutamicibacter sp. AOP5-A2-18 TaxID=3457656 RepID=UPI0040345A17
MKIALAQVLSTSDPQRNLVAIRDHAKQAKEAGASLVIFPEAMQVAFGNDLAKAAVALDGPWPALVRQQAREIGITIVAGMFTPGEGGRVRNTLLIAGPEADTHYDKIHLYDAFGYAESDTVTPGNTPVQFSHEGQILGVATCYDLRFPQLFIRHATSGAAVNIVCASWGAGEGKVEQWTTLAKARALDSTTFVAAVGQADPESVGRQVSGTAPLGVGHSLVVDPLGRVIAQAGAEPELLVVDLDLAVVEKARQQLPVLANTVDL